MKIKITFNKNNADALVEKYVLYRSPVSNGLFAEANIIKVFDREEFEGIDKIEYLDPTADYDAKYYYGLATESIEGFSTVSAIREITIPKYVGSMSREVMIGDYNHGFVNFESATPDLELTCRLLFSQIIAVSNASISPTSDKSNCLNVYSNGKPLKIIFNQNLPLQTASSNPGNTWFYRCAEELKAKISNETYFIDGFEYRIRLLKTEEWLAFASHLSDRFQTSSFNRAVAQRVVPAWGNAASFSSSVVALDDDDGIFVGRPSIDGDTVIKLENTNTYTYSYCTVPFVMEPVAY